MNNSPFLKIAIIPERDSFGVWRERMHLIRLLMATKQQ